jgi:hypothetical protein
VTCIITPIIPLDTNSVPAASLPVTCMLDNPPTGITIGAAVLTDSTGKDTPLPVTGGNSFQIPKTMAKNNYTLSVRLEGPLGLGVAVFVVEDCPAKTQVLFVGDPVSKLGQCILEVV